MAHPSRIDGSVIATLAQPEGGWSTSVDTTRLSEGGHTLTAALLNDGRVADTDQVRFTVDNCAPYERSAPRRRPPASCRSG